jgi:hypothetical protein
MRTQFLQQMGLVLICIFLKAAPANVIQAIDFDAATVCLE